MKFKIDMIGIITVIVAALAISVFSDDTLKVPGLLEGKIWFESDTINLLKNNAGNSLLAVPGDTVNLENSRDEGDSLFREGVIELPATNISKDAKTLKLKLLLPGTLKFIKDAPIELVAQTSDPEILEVGKSPDKNPEKPLTFPITVNPGKADLFLYYRVVCCTTGPEGICFFKEARLKLPVTVGDYENTVLEIRHEIED